MPRFCLLLVACGFALAACSIPGGAPPGDGQETVSPDSAGDADDADSTADAGIDVSDDPTEGDSTAADPTDPDSADGAELDGEDGEEESPDENGEDEADPEDAPPVTLIGVQLAALPTRCAYSVGESPSLAGLLLRASYSDGTERDVALEDLTVSGASADAPGIVPVTVAYGGQSAAFNLLILPADYAVAFEAASWAMGSDTDTYKNNPSHEARLSAFCLAHTELTYRLWAAVVGWIAANPGKGYQLAARAKEGNDGTVNAPVDTAGTEPVVAVNWMEAVVWCNAFSEMSGLTPVYGGTPDAGASADGIIRTSAYTGSVLVIPGADGWRLPTEAEWEYAAGATAEAGIRTRYSGTDNLSDLPDYAWTSKNSADVSGKVTTHPVGEKLPSAKGLYDLSGNAEEWCFDWYDASYYAVSPVADPLGPEAPPEPANPNRVIRGGNYSDKTTPLAVATRSSAKWSTRSGYIGFRLARSVGKS